MIGWEQIMPTGIYPRRHYAGKRLIKKEDLMEFKGMLMCDIAAELRCHRSKVERAIKRHGIRHLFPAHGGESQQVGRKGYCE